MLSCLAKKNNSHGFTLLEVIIAIGLILVGLIGLLTLISFTIANSRFSANHLIAAHLAQEGIEAVRNERDSKNNWNAWYSSILDGSYRLDMNLINYQWALMKDDTPYEEILSVDQGTDTNTGLYFYDQSGTPVENILTSFSRGISVVSLDKDTKQVVSEVRWREGERQHSLIIEGRLYNWRPKMKF